VPDQADPRIAWQGAQKFGSTCREEAAARRRSTVISGYAKPTAPSASRWFSRPNRASVRLVALPILRSASWKLLCYDADVLPRRLPRPSQARCQSSAQAGAGASYVLAQAARSVSWFIGPAASGTAGMITSRQTRPSRTNRAHEDPPTCHPAGRRVRQLVPLETVSDLAKLRHGHRPARIALHWNRCAPRRDG